MIVLKLYITDAGQNGTWYNSFRQLPKKNLKEKVMESSQKVIPMTELEKIITNIERFEKEILRANEVEPEKDKNIAEQIRLYRRENIVLRRLVKAYARKNQKMKKELGFDAGKINGRKIG